MTKVLVIQGAGMNMRGKSQVEIFGPATITPILAFPSQEERDYFLGN